jgi:hypothetical protein
MGSFTGETHHAIDAEAAGSTEKAPLWHLPHGTGASGQNPVIIEDDDSYTTNRFISLTSDKRREPEPFSLSPTVESSPTRYRRFRYEEASDSDTMGGKDKQLVQVVTKRDEFRSEQPATETDASVRPASNDDEHRYVSPVEHASPPEDDQWEVEELCGKRRDLYHVMWKSTWVNRRDIEPGLVERFEAKRGDLCLVEWKKTWEHRRDIHPGLVESYNKKNKRRGKKGARRGKGRRVGKIYTMKKTGKAGRP